jgi:hypothetical protein
LLPLEVLLFLDIFLLLLQCTECTLPGGSRVGSRLTR